METPTNVYMTMPPRGVDGNYFGKQKLSKIPLKERIYHEKARVFGF
jgi:hypothetical protein